MIIFLTWFPIFATYDIYRSYSVKKSIKNNINPKSTRKSNKNTIKNNNNNNNKSKVTHRQKLKINVSTNYSQINHYNHKSKITKYISISIPNHHKKNQTSLI